MKNKLFLLVFSVVMMASLSMFAGCSDVQDVAVDWTTSGSVSGLTSKVETYNSNQYAIVLWNAVDNVSGYTVYSQKEGKKLYMNYMVLLVLAMKVRFIISLPANL